MFVVSVPSPVTFEEFINLVISRWPLDLTSQTLTFPCRKPVVPVEIIVSIFIPSMVLLMRFQRDVEDVFVTCGMQAILLRCVQWCEHGVVHPNSWVLIVLWPRIH